MLTIYDWHGNYGHPDHIKVHRVGHRAAELAGTPAVFEATMNRDALSRRCADATARPAGDADGGTPTTSIPNGPADDGNPFGMPEAELTHAVDVSAYVDQKRAAIALPRQPGHRHRASSCRCRDEVFATAFGTEWFIKHGAPRRACATGWLFE